MVSRSAKPTPYAVCYGCNGSVQIEVHEVSRDMVTETWHVECYEAENGGEGEDDAEVLTALAVVEEN